MKAKPDTSDRFVIIMAGGRGERFWPVSREKMPKQLITLLGDRSFLQQAVDRVLPLVPREEHPRHHQRGAGARGAQATAEAAEGECHRRADRPRHLRGGYAGRRVGRGALDHRRHGGASGRSRHSRGEEVPAGPVGRVRPGRPRAGHHHHRHQAHRAGHRLRLHSRRRDAAAAPGG